MSKFKKILVVPDSHVEPGQSNVRAEWLGRMLEEEEPTHLVHIGDIAEMGSMSFYDPIKSTAYTRDCEAVHDFLYKFKKAAGSAYDDVQKVFLEGNHEARIRRRVIESPELKEAIDLKGLGVYEYFDKVVEWRGGPGVYNLAGIMFSHYVQNRMGRAIGGVNHARSLLLETMQSTVVGHSHALNYHSKALPNGRHIHGLVSGCFFEHEHEWAGQNSGKYWRGVAVLHDVRQGEYDLELISMHRMKKRYG